MELVVKGEAITADMYVGDDMTLDAKPHRPVDFLDPFFPKGKRSPYSFWCNLVS